jgi:hypothetical protein
VSSTSAISSVRGKHNTCAQPPGSSRVMTIWQETMAAGPRTESILRREGQNLCINETGVAIIWDEPMPNVGRPWFGCACGRKVRYLYLSETIRCAKCHVLQNAILHQGRRTPAVRRVARLRQRLGGCALQPFTPLPMAPSRLLKKASNDAP